MGRQKYAFLPYPESDFIFAVVGEDLGLIGCLSVLALFAAFVFFGLRIAIRCDDRFGSLLAGGITSMIGVQCVMNVAVVIGLMPTTGLPLPFFSAGGTSISILMCGVAVLMNISAAARRGKEVRGFRPKAPAIALAPPSGDARRLRCSAAVRGPRRAVVGVPEASGTRSSARGLAWGLDPEVDENCAAARIDGTLCLEA